MPCCYFKPVAFHCSWPKIQIPYHGLQDLTWFGCCYFSCCLLWLFSLPDTFLLGFPFVFLKHVMLFLTLSHCLWCSSSMTLGWQVSSIPSEFTPLGVPYLRWSSPGSPYHRPSQPLSHNVLILLIYLLLFWSPILPQFKFMKMCFIFGCVLHSSLLPCIY